MESTYIDALRITLVENGCEAIVNTHHHNSCCSHAFALRIHCHESDWITNTISYWLLWLSISQL